MSAILRIFAIHAFRSEISQSALYARSGDRDAAPRRNGRFFVVMPLIRRTSGRPLSALPCPVQ